MVVLSIDSINTTGTRGRSEILLQSYSKIGASIGVERQPAGSAHPTARPPFFAFFNFCVTARDPETI